MDDASAPFLDNLAARVTALEDGLRFHAHKGYDLSTALSKMSVSTVQVLQSSSLGDGISNSGTLTMRLAPNQGDVYIRANIDAGDFSNAGAKTGFIFGLDDSDSDKAKFYFGAPGAYIKFDGTTLSVVGSVSVGSLDIPDQTTANSFHTDTAGNSWWGANVATGYTGANAYILNNGSAVFKNVSIGGTAIQYVITNSGIFSYGDGSDGAGAADGSTALAGASRSGSVYTLTRDVYYTTLTVNSGVTINPAGYRIFGTGVLTLNGNIARNGNAGANGTGPYNSGLGDSSFPTAGGGALADGYLKGSVAGGRGGGLFSGGAQGGEAGTNTSNSLGFNGANGAAIIAGGLGGTATASNVKLIANWHLATLLDISSSGSTVKFNNSAGAGGGSSSIVSGGFLGFGGGGGSAGGIIAIYFRSIIISGTGAINANGGAGGTGGDSGTPANSSGGGGGGNGGIIVLTYNQLSNAGSITATAGLGGAGSGSSPVAGTNGTAGVTYQFQLSL